MKKHILLLTLVSVAGLSLHGMEEGMHTPPPKRQRTEQGGSASQAARTVDSDGDELSEKELALRIYQTHKKTLNEQVVALRYSPERDRSIEVISLAYKPDFKALRQRELGKRVSLTQRALCCLNQRITRLQEVSSQSGLLRSESQRVLGSVKMGTEFSRIEHQAGQAREELVNVRNDIASGGTFLAGRTQAREHLNRDLLGALNAAGAGDFVLPGE